ncbi:hypothetical protein PIB30_059126 [Stylosanthes scabra]|uniref:Bromodomain associated domain-containing protein n=1 Tax=Stylosanthes scabra TaxID=79078 RepID=A0ABU6SK60_9FABA|nr:hypothetical protein [Stylosanthes scabra]
MNPVQSSHTAKSKLKPSQRAKSKKKRDLQVKDVVLVETPSQFSFAIARTAVARICQSVGYKKSTHGTLETLTNVAMKYLEATARSAASFANASNRTEVNLFDLINGIHDLCSVQGFPGGSELHTNDLLKSGALKEIMNFVKYSNEVTFSKPILHKNVSRIPKLKLESVPDSRSSLCSNETKCQGFHIPRWLPDFPEEKLYKNCDKVSVKERKFGEKLWEHSLGAEHFSCKLDENKSESQIHGINGKEENTRIVLGQGRGRVKFRMVREEEKHVDLSVNLMNGVCKRRKRVSWNLDKINNCMAVENEDEMSACKRKKFA